MANKRTTALICSFVAVVAALLAQPATAADPLSMATGPQGTVTYNMGLAIAKAGSVHHDMDLRLRPYKSTSQGSGIVDTGEVNFGLENALGMLQAHKGEGAFAGAALSNIRLVATLIPFRVTFGVRLNDPAKTIADLKGRRIASGFRGAVVGEPLIKALLSTAGLSYADVVAVEVSDLTAQTEGFIAGTIDAYTSVLGSSRDEQLNEELGGIRALPLGAGEGVLEKIREFLPPARIVVVDPEPGLIGISEPTPIIEYDYYVYASADTPDAAVRDLIDSLTKGKAEMEAVVTGFRWFEPTKMAGDIGVPYHPAAEAYYKEAGIWPQ